MITQVPGFPRREEVPAPPSSSQAGLASIRRTDVCSCGNPEPFVTKWGRMCWHCADDMDREVAS